MDQTDSGGLDVTTQHLLLFLALVLPPQGQAAPFDSGRLSFAMAVRDDLNPYHVLALCVLPGETLTFQLKTPTGEVPAVPEPLTASAAAGEWLDQSPTRWQWRAPNQTRPIEIRFSHEGTGETMRFQILMMKPLSEVRDGKLENYRIGAYPDKMLKDLAIYRQPPGLARIEEQDLDLAVAPHFTLRQFVCKQSDGFPKYLVLRERLLLKLEYLLERVNQAGHQVPTFYVMSGFRTPFYNKSIGNVKYSRHCWGGAADIFIDVAPSDGTMDDLNGDGMINVKDAMVMYEWIDGMNKEKSYRRFIGGLGLYRRTPNHGPFVHVDVRGFRARWGD